jgi:hypothetical protein
MIGWTTPSLRPNAALLLNKTQNHRPFRPAVEGNRACVKHLTQQVWSCKVVFSFANVESSDLVSFRFLLANGMRPSHFFIPGGPARGFPFGRTPNGTYFELAKGATPSHK